MAASFSLIIEDDAGKQIVVPFAKDVITIGRKEGNTIRLTERNVSRFHARLSKESSHIVVEDLTSFNGVKLNGDRIAGRVEVGAGDVIEIGDYHLELRTAQPSATTQKMGPAGAKSAAIDHQPAAEDDEFEGETQRWDQPPGASLPSAPTIEMRVTPAGGPVQPFDADGDTERLDLDKMPPLASATGGALNNSALTPAQSWPPPPRAASPMPALVDTDATARQPTANIPFSAALPPTPVVVPPAAAPVPTPPPSPPPAFSAPTALTAPLLAAPAGDDELDATQDMPLPAVVQARANLQAQGVGVRREPNPVEQTEQLRIAPAAVAAAAAAEELSLPRLVVLNTIFAGSSFPLRAPENVLGRTDDNDIVLEHRSVSRNHAKLVREGERVRILDLKSANGVLVNGEEVEQHVLKSGDVVELGRVRLRFVPVGERFVVPPEEIERARIADANGDDDGEVPVVTANVGSPLRNLDGGEPKKPIALYAVLVVLVILVLVLGGIVLNRDEPAQVAPPTTVGQAQPGAEGDAVDTATVRPADAAVGSDVAAKPADDQPIEAVDAAPTDKPTDKPVDKVATKEPEAKPREAKEAKEPPAAKEAPIDNEKQFEEARRALFSNDAARGVKLLDELVKRSPREPRYQLALAAGYKQLKQFGRARQHYEAFLQLQPSGAEAEKVRSLLADMH